MPTYDDSTLITGPSSTAMECEYTDFTAETGDFLGIGRDTWSTIEQTRLDSILKSALRQVYYPLNPKTQMEYQWSWMRPKATIVTTAAYDTGTVEIASGVVTLTTGTFPTWAAEGEIHISGQIYTVNTRDSGTQVTLDDLTVTVAAGTTYTLSRPSYDLPAGFDGSFDGDLHNETGDNTLWPPIEFKSPAVLRVRKQSYNGTDRPLYASFQPTSFDATVGQRWQITFFPAPSSAWTFYGRYKLRPSMLDGTDKYPLGGSAMCEVYLASCLAVAEERFVEDSKIHRERFNLLLLQAIENDADSFSADSLGYNSDRSELNGSNLDRRFDNAIHSVEGITYYD